MPAQLLASAVRWSLGAGIAAVFVFGLATMMHNSSAAAAGDRTADLVLLGGKVATMDDRLPQAEAVAVRGGRIVAVGSDQEIRSCIGPGTEQIDLEGKLVVPGFIEGHGHFVGLGEARQTLDLTGAKSWGEIVTLVRSAASRTPPGRWITGRGWHQGKWDRVPEPNAEGYPMHDALSRAVPDHPVLLTHASGHALMANAKAMELAGVTRHTRDPEGGVILRDAAGDPTGLFREEAEGLIRAAQVRGETKRTPQERLAELDEAIRLAGEECLAHGVTSFHEAGASFETIDRYRQLAEQRRLPVRLYVMIGESNLRLARRLDQYRIIGLGDHHLTVRAIKRFIDGALGTHGAWLLEPYDDLPSSGPGQVADRPHVGLNTTPLDSLRETAELAVEHGFQLCVHAIGDRANRETLNLYEGVFRRHTEKKDLRWRIEHAQHLDPADIPRFGRLGVIAAMQGIHATSDAPFVVQRLGAKRAAEGAYAWRSLLDSGAVVVNGTDAPVERVDPIASIYASVTRKLADGTAFFPQQRMTRQEALRSYTRAAAFAAFEDDLKGSITPGKLADFTVLDRDMLTVPEDQIRQARIAMTIIGGNVVFRRESRP